MMYIDKASKMSCQLLWPYIITINFIYDTGLVISNVLVTRNNIQCCF